MLARQLTIEELASEIPDGSKVALPPDYAYCALSAVRALIRQQKRERRGRKIPLKQKPKILPSLRMDLKTRRKHSNRQGGKQVRNPQK